MYWMGGCIELSPRLAEDDSRGDDAGDDYNDGMS